MPRMIICLEVDVFVPDEEKAHQLAEHYASVLNAVTPNGQAAKVAAVETVLDLGSEGELERFLAHLTPRV